MKLTRIFGIVLGLHVGVIVLVMLQPGCQPGKQDLTLDANETSLVEPDPLNSFNEGVSSQDPVVPKSENEFVSPTRPKSGGIIVPGQVEPVVPVIDPLATESTTESTPLRPTDVSIYTIQRGDTLWGIARKNQLSMNQLLSSNPNLSKDTRLSIGQEIMIPAGGATSTASDPIAPIPVEGGVTYVVKPGDSLSRIARDQGVSLALLMQANRMNSSSIIRPGQSLVIPEQSGGSTSISTQSITVPSGAISHTVKKGENLTRIAAVYGVTIKQIMEWNNLADAGKIRVGQSLIVSSGDLSTSENAPIPVPAQGAPAETSEDPSPVDNESLENFFKGNVEDPRPVIEVQEE